MATNTQNTTSIAVTPSSVLSSKPQARFQKRNFDSLVDQKGYPVIIEKAIECPCASVGSQALPNCRNCGGSGWLWYNPKETKVVITSMNRDTQFKQWSKEAIGIASVTTYHEIELGYMDKITVSEALLSYSQLLSPVILEDTAKLIARLTYVPRSIEAMFRFDGENNPLVRLVEGTDYTITDNIIELADSLKSVSGLRVVCRYRHNPQFVVLDLNRGTISSPSLHHATKIEGHQEYPIHGVARTLHYVLNEDSISGNYLHDNSFTDDFCPVKN